jgi:peptide/nickel transport system ATP-binding protein
MNDKILQVRNLKVYYESIFGEYKATDGVSFDVIKGEIFGIAGESGCGKSTLVEGVLRLVKPPGYVKEGKVFFKNIELLSLGEDELRKIRWKEIAYIPQGAMNSLNPLLKVREQMIDAVIDHSEGRIMTEEAEKIAENTLKAVGLPIEIMDMYAFELSGGMKQRVIIAMASALNPSLIVADEPTTALDVITLRHVIEALTGLKEKFATTIVLVTHDMAVHAEIADQMAIMYAGKIVEIGDTYDIFYDPLHPYTRGLLGAIPSLERKKIRYIPGGHPSPLNWPLGCRFHPRCPQATDKCKREVPEMKEVSTGRYVACHFY